MLKFGFEKFLAASLLLALLSGQAKATVSHVVFIWAKNDTDKEQIIAMIDRAEMLSTIVEVRSIAVGTAVPSDRSNVDDSYDVGITLTFDSVAAMQAYLVHPQHIEYVSVYVKPYAQTVLVYDIEHD
jgi:hypothetical protein